jgi:hypothetical protein
MNRGGGREERMVERIEKKTRNTTMCHNMTVRTARPHTHTHRKEDKGMTDED